MDQQVVRWLRIIALLLAILVVQVGWIGIQLFVRPVRAQIVKPIDIIQPLDVEIREVTETDPIPVKIHDVTDPIPVEIHDVMYPIPVEIE